MAGRVEDVLLAGSNESGALAMLLMSAFLVALAGLWVVVYLTRS